MGDTLEAVDEVRDDRDQPTPYAFIAGLSDREAEKLAELEQAAALEPLFAADSEKPRVAFPGRPEQYVTLRRLDAFQARKWRNISSKMSAEFPDEESGKPAEGHMRADLGEAYLYLCMVGIEEYRIAKPGEPQPSRGGWSRKFEGQAERGEIAKETRALFGALNPRVSDWLERVLMGFNGLTPEQRRAKVPASDFSESGEPDA